MRRFGVIIIVIPGLLGGCSEETASQPPDRLADSLGHRLSVTDADGVAHQPLVSEDGGLTVLLFITTDCPISNSYAPRVQRMVEEYGPRGVAFYLVHVDPGLAPAEARRHAEEFGYTRPVLLDPDHALVDFAGAEVTPEAVVVGPDGAILYRGRIDDQYADLGVKRIEPTRHDLQVAMDAALAGEPAPEPRVPAVGCYIPSLPDTHP